MGNTTISTGEFTGLVGVVARHLFCNAVQEVPEERWICGETLTGWVEGVWIGTKKL